MLPCKIRSWQMRRVSRTFLEKTLLRRRLNVLICLSHSTTVEFRTSVLQLMNLYGASIWNGASYLPFKIPCLVLTSITKVWMYGIIKHSSLSVL